MKEEFGLRIKDKKTPTAIVNTENDDI